MFIMYSSVFLAQNKVCMYVRVVVIIDKYNETTKLGHFMGKKKVYWGQTARLSHKSIEWQLGRKKTNLILYDGQQSGMGRFFELIQGVQVNQELERYILPVAVYH